MPEAKLVSRGQQLESKVCQELRKIQGLVDAFATKTVQLQELFLKRQYPHNHLGAKLARLDLIRLKSNVQCHVDSRQVFNLVSLSKPCS